MWVTASALNTTHSTGYGAPAMASPNRCFVHVGVVDRLAKHVAPHALVELVDVSVALDPPERVADQVLLLELGPPRKHLGNGPLQDGVQLLGLAVLNRGAGESEPDGELRADLLQVLGALGLEVLDGSHGVFAIFRSILQLSIQDDCTLC